MGMELYFNVWEKGEPGQMPLADLDAAFADAIVHRETEGDEFFWRLEYAMPGPEWKTSAPRDEELTSADAWTSADVYGAITEGTVPPMCNGLTFSGAPDHPAFYASLIRLLQGATSAVFWPGENALVIGQKESIPHLPQDMIESLGEPLPRDPAGRHPGAHRAKLSVSRRR
ncbi:MAG: hypothetical protein GAK35_00480 [Herbaspirillum frisingense]|uniref:Uncharacterized protein n=1 Tax=Herbaspirillum frisingense TaxID=92645 RepID=A0A7V8JVM9_9BURK|nr:MAG: hypothetical protein GAK35_00480 [Herbaspirillum frisingense]